MLIYYNEELTFNQFIQYIIINNEQKKGYILISDERLYNEKLKLDRQPVNIIKNIYNFQLVLIESWKEMYQLLDIIDTDSFIGIYGIFKHFIEDGMNDHHEFVKYYEFCGYELNKLFHKLFKKHIDLGVKVIVNDSIGNNEDNEPLIWNFHIPNIRKEQELKPDDFEISLRVLFIKWFELIQS
ncbi:unnamed protein product [Candida verbasci]|uniref:Uncharacterized protein n=1 Tax=Candida verbasci TaxID=1227364 RepID=A0A9W4XFP3_9ASCO|nr:unnamed protein product [Candida verbasci]